MRGRTAPMTAPVAQLARVREIATVLWAGGLTWLVDALGLWACVSLRCRTVCALGARPCEHHAAMDQPLPERLRLVLERLGHTFVKAGQMLALRPDYVPAAYTEALRGLYADVPPFPAGPAARVVTEELGRPPQEVFAAFEPQPFAAASLSQVHRARLPDGTAVAVKVQRPGAARQVKADLALLRRLERRSPTARQFRPVAAVDELAEWTLRELDFHREARTAQALRRHFADDDTVVIPRVHEPWTTRRVLTMDLIEGQPTAPAAELRRTGLDPQRVLEAGARAVLRQIFEFGLFHADPHPGNLLVLPGERVAFLDFGMFGRVDRRQRHRMGIMLCALTDGDYDAAVGQLLHLSERAPDADVPGFRHAVADLVEDWYGHAARDYSVARLLLAELGAGAAHGIVFPRELMLLARTLLTLESTGALIDPDTTLADLTRAVLPDLKRILLPTPATLAHTWADTRLDTLALAL
ncbi:AarF/ABC1/UbiB kinase family protein [Streptomyces sp. WAC00263]|uniref:ABC1 kinase family protein n=1 Tax=Streptomyces sp. WAC00263 TaxID=1917422 RepID=UPI0015EF7092|nr:AarF/UbiB family protein [Streptomyces sp. WAC00263]